ncbi:diguanylate cyclase (GGDEF) domain-containing protein [Blastococcus sp. DSM 46786]|uniref:putative bifunctional diguanylate cyclase/phosphodiesterase n=1 Tax=Blastococcus sp. DSM 46786 TaxID=1798227 RepID=UPI0008BD9DA7|nr:EAL domain-containing protein [Blastococcus sp. DSM 46786]SEK49154.1 diguanylate cyclase (GGDEF) domain-containing protein [Blastococcus sp. DSM 46786]
MSLLHRLRGTSLLARFGAVSLLLTFAVGAVLSSVLSTAIENRARQQAEDAALMAVRLGLQPQFTPVDLAEGFEAERLADVESAVNDAAEEFGTAGLSLAAFDPIELKIFNRDRTIVYHSENPELVGETSGSGELGAALDGYVVSGFAHSADDSATSEDGTHQLLEVYVPMQYDGADSPDGVIELYLPYAPVAAAVATDVRTMTIALVASLTVFHLVVFRLIASASKKLRRQTEDLRSSAERDRHQATHDALTGLPNWELLRDRLDQALAAASRSDGEVALFLIDLDRFKEINDTLGHSFGDRLLCQVGPRLESVLREGDTVARLGGDEFTVLLPLVDGAGEAEQVAERLREALHRPFDVDGVAVDVEASIGIVVSPWHGTDTEVLLRNADIAMYVAKEFKSGAVIFEPEEHVTAPSRLTVLGDLRRALEGAGELFLNYQPKYTLDGERIEGLEALLRWRHPVHGLIPPDDFIPAAEGTGIILRLTEHVLDLALAQMRCWMDAGHGVPVAVNLSTRCLLDVGLPELVRRLLTAHRVPAELLRLEVTESAVMGDAARSMEVLQRLHDLGVKLSIDDFGTGYTSMAHLRRLPVDELKIDRSFVLGMISTAHDAVLVRTAVDLGHNLGLTVVAEGVEGAEHVAALRDLGCDIAQGYHYARPMGGEQMSELLDRVGTIHDGSMPVV